MSKKFTIAFIAGTVAAAAIAAYLIKRNNTKKRLEKIADEGFETAADVFFPGSKNGAKQHYGPVIPS